MLARRLKERKCHLVVALTVSAMVGVALIAEGVVRLRSYVKHGHGSIRIENVYQTDSRTGLRTPRPEAQLGGIKINELGFRGEEIDEPKPQDRVRLAFIGGSTTFCAEVTTNENAWPHLVTQSLNSLVPKFDYINAAVPGYTVLASRKRLMTEVAPLDPDIVIIYHASNDLAKNGAREAERRGLLLSSGDMALSIPGRYSMLWYLLEKNFWVWQRQRRALNPTGKLDVPLQVLSKPFADDLAQLVAEARHVAETVVLITFTTRLRPHQSEEERRRAAITSLYYMPYMTPDQLLSAFAAYNSVIREVAGASGAFLIEGEADIPADDAHFVDSIHFTDRGSRSMADHVYHGLIDSGALASYL